MSKYTVIIFILALYVLCVGVFATPPPDIEGQTNYGTEWTITGAEYRGNQTIILDGNLTIESGGSLILYNVTLMMNNTNYSGEYNIEVKNGGTLNIINGSIITDSPYDVDDNSTSDYEFMLMVRDGAGFIMEDSELHECGYDSSNTGLTIETNNVEIKNSVLSNNYYAIHLYNSDGNNIVGNNISNNWNGIYLRNSNSNNIIGNNATSSNDYGIFLDSSSGNTINGNNASSNKWHGILLDFSSGNTITGNNASSNNWYGIYLWDSTGNNIIGNTASNNRYGVNIRRSNGNTITGNDASSNNDHGIYLRDSSGNMIANNTVNSNDNYGIYLPSSSSNTITNNTASLNNEHGINLEGSYGNNITGNTATSNSNYGINLYFSGRNNITVNNVSSNINGIYLYESSKNNITDNYVTNNEWGLYLASSNWNNITGNNHLLNNAGGISLIQSSQGNTINNNNVTLNTMYGISVEYSNGNNVSDNFASSNFGIGIFVYNSNGTTIMNNNVSNTGNGILIDESHDNNITSNTALSNTDSGIYLDLSSKNNIANNNLTNNLKGITVDSSDGNIITGNNASSNSFFGIRLISSYENNITKNEVILNGGSGIKLQSSSGNNVINNLVYDNDLGISLSNSKENYIAENNLSWNFWENIHISATSDGNNVTNNTATTSNKGIYIYQSSHNNITGNNISNNGWGIHLESSSKNNITDNNITSNVASGIYLESSDDNLISKNNGTNNEYAYYIESSNANNIDNNYASVNLFGLYLDSSDWNNITNNSMYMNTNMGAYLGNSNWNNITGNVFSKNDDIGIMLWYSTGNKLSENTALNHVDTGISIMDSSGNYLNNNFLIDNRKGINLRDSTGNNITSNSLFNNYYGIRLRTSSGNNITNNNISSVNDYGIILSSSHGNNIKGNNASNNEYCIYLDSSNENNIIENNVSNSQWYYGIYLDSSNGNNMTANKFLINGYGVFLSASSNNIIENSNISSSYFYGIQAEANSQNNLIANSSFFNSRLNNIYLADNSSITAINTTFNESKIYFDDTKSTLTVKWFMHVYVKSTDDLPISNVTVFVSNITNDQVEGSPFTTGIDGYVRWIIVTERVQNSTTNVSHTPNNVSVTLNGIKGYAEPDPVMNLSKVILIILDTEKPIANAGIDSSVDEDEIHAFDGSGSVDNIGMRNWTWDFGDGIFGYGEAPTHTYTFSGFYVVVLNVTDTAGNWDIDTVTIFVNNVLPTAVAGNDTMGDEGKQIYFDGSNSIDTASDIDSLIYTWDFGDGTIGMGKMVNHSYEDNGTYTVTLQVTDDDGTTSIDSIKITMNNTAPKITPISPLFLLEDQIYTLHVIATDVKGDILTFSDNTTMFDIDSATGDISFTPSNADVGMHLINVTVVDDDEAESHIEIQFTIQNTNDAPIITSSPITIAIENSTYYYNLTVVDDDLDTTAYELDMKPDGMTIDSNGRIIWTPTYQQASQTFMVIVNVSDGSDFVTQTFSITVMNVNDKPTITLTPVFTATEDVLYTYDVDAVDVDIGDRLIYRLDTAPIGMSIDSSTGLITWVPTNDQVGDNEVVVNVTDSMGAFATQEFSILVSNANDAPVLEPIGPLIATEDQPFYYQAIATDIDLYDTLSFYDDYELFQIDEDTGIISFMPLNDDVGTYTLKIMVQDAEGAMDNETIIFMVLNVNDSPTLDFISDRELTEDLPFTLIVTASDIDSDDSITFLDNTTLFDINSYTGEISFTPTNEYVGTHLVNITVKDKSDGITYMIVTFIINNVNDPPLIESIGGLTAMMDKAFSYTLMATDIDPGNILTFSDDTEIFDIDPNTGEISFTPSKKDAGVHYVTITVTDEEGETNQTTVTFTILEAEAEELFDYTGILLIIIVGLIAFFIGYFIRRKEERELPKEEEECIEEPEEIEMELLEEEPEEEEKLEGLEKRPPSLPPEEEEPVEFELMEAEGIDSEESEASLFGQVGEAYL